MKKILIAILLSGLGSSVYGDSSPTQEMIQTKLEQLTQVDEQIEKLVKQRVQLKAEAAKDVARGANSVLPRQARREDRSAEQVSEQVQALSQQIQQLEAQRQEILMALQ
ncbi:MAG: hypothetical protein V4489_06425 [Chlamydiota bacterium]